MKRILSIAIATLGLSTAAHAQGPQDVTTLLNNVDGALNGAVSQGQDGVVALINGDVTNTFNNFEQANTGFATALAANTPGESLAQTYDSFSRAGYDALVPLYQALDGPAMQGADALAPLGDPAAQAVSDFDFNLVLDIPTPELPGGDALPGAGSIPGLDSAPGLDGLSTDALPLDALDPATLTSLADGAALPGLPQ